MQRNIILFICMVICISASPAFAYVGPGPAFSFIGSFFTLIGGVVLALAMVLLYPLRIMLKRMKQRKAEKPDDRLP